MLSIFSIGIHGSIIPNQQTTITNTYSTVITSSSLTTFLTSTYQTFRTTIFSTSTTVINISPETIYDIHAANDCNALGLIADVNSFRSDFTGMNGNGEDKWQLDYYMTSLSENMVVKLSFTTINGYHNASQSVYINGVYDKNHSLNVSVPIHGDITNGQDIDFYTDGDGGQVFWYSAGQISILFSYNFPNFSDKPLTVFNNEKIVFAPIPETPAQSVLFTNLHMNVQIGEQFATPQPPQNIPVIATPQSDGTPCSLSMITPPDTNTQQVLVGNKNNNTMAEINISSP